MLKKPELFEDGFHLDIFSTPEIIKTYIHAEDWKSLDEEFKKQTAPQGELFKYLNQFYEFNEIEFIISIRDANNQWEEDGIWHDDGSRVFAFSLSLTEGPIEGGKLGIRRKTQDQIFFIPTPKFNEIILFLTGIHGYEHKIHQVTSGRRIIIAGWCS
jgi:hypothetical protein